MRAMIVLLERYCCDTHHRRGHSGNPDGWYLRSHGIRVNFDFCRAGHHQCRTWHSDHPGRLSLVTFAIALIIEGVLGYFFTTNMVQIHAWYIDAALPIGGFYLNYIYIFVFLLSVVLLSALYLLVYRTTFGRRLRASMQNRTAASLIGINVEQVQAITFGIGVSLAAAGGMAFGATNSFNPASSYDLIYRLLVIIVLGGMGSLRGALIASLVMVIIGDVTALVWSPVWSSTVFFVLLVALLLFRPQGLFGRLEGRKQ